MYSSAVKCLPSVHKAPGFIPAAVKRLRKAFHPSSQRPSIHYWKGVYTVNLHSRPTGSEAPFSPLGTQVKQFTQSHTEQNWSHHGGCLLSGPISTPRQGLNQARSSPEIGYHPCPTPMLSADHGFTEKPHFWEMSSVESRRGLLWLLRYHLVVSCDGEQMSSEVVLSPSQVT